ncbi:GatB/YqeY domain-containing protein [Jackrogersella minutella]|nr:GatB/YqeY domain-containing protein [Jackrogersella minutella]
MAALRPSPRIAERLLLRTPFTPIPFSSTRLSPLSLRCSARYSQEAAPLPPLLLKIKGDLKPAMRAKDAVRLTAIRSVISAELNASKTSGSHIQTDAEVVALLRKLQRACTDASAEFAAGGRQDLVDKEQAQIDVFSEYIGQSGDETMSEEDLRSLVSDTISLARETNEPVKVGDVMKLLLAPGGPLQGKDVDKALLAKIVKEAMS